MIRFRRRSVVKYGRIGRPQAYGLLAASCGEFEAPAAIATSSFRNFKLMP
jgi:hypothetical protein